MQREILTHVYTRTQGEVTNNGQEAQAGPTPQETTAGNNTATEIADATEERSKRVYVGNLAVRSLRKSSGGCVSVYVLSLVDFVLC